MLGQHDATSGYADKGELPAQCCANIPFFIARDLEGAHRLFTRSNDRAGHEHAPDAGRTVSIDLYKRIGDEVSSERKYRVHLGEERANLLSAFELASIATVPDGRFGKQVCEPVCVILLVAVKAVSVLQRSDVFERNQAGYIGLKC